MVTSTGPRRLIFRFGRGGMHAIDLRLLRPLLPIVLFGLRVGHRDRLTAAELDEVCRLVPLMIRHSAGLRVSIRSRISIHIAII